MPMFEYKGYDSKGKTAQGLRDADSVKALRVLLKRQGILATEIREAASGAIVASSAKASVLSKEVRFRGVFRGVSSASLGMATRQLGTLLQSGIPMVDALNALIDQVDNPNLKRMLSEIKSDVNEGSTLADAMKKHSAFSGIYVNMVRAGETSGSLEIVLERLADFLDGQARLKSKVLSAMMYPAVMVGFSGLILTALMTLVVPRIAQILTSSKIELPLTTRFLIGLSNLMLGYWWLLLILVGAGVFWFMRWRKSPQGRPKWDRTLLRLPVVGPLILMVAIARFSRTLSTLLGAGVPLLTSLQIVRNVVSNHALETAIEEIREAVREGEDIATPLKRSGQFPPMVTHMIAIGEKSGELESMLMRIANNYEGQVDTRVSTLTSLLEPVMIVVMGGVVAFIVFSILTPIMQMSQMAR